MSFTAMELQLMAGGKLSSTVFHLSPTLEKLSLNPEDEPKNQLSQVLQPACGQFFLNVDGQGDCMHAC